MLKFRTAGKPLALLAVLVLADLMSAPAALSQFCGTRGRETQVGSRSRRSNRRLSSRRWGPETGYSETQEDPSVIRDSRAAVKVIVQGEPEIKRALLFDAADVIDTRVVEVASDTSVDDLLVSKGIKADVYSKSVFMDLNPDVENVEVPVSGGRTVVVPFVRGTEVKFRPHGKTYWYAIALHPEKYIELEKRLDQLKLYTSTVSDSGSVRFVSPEVQDAYTKAMKDNVQLLEELKATPVNTETLNRVHQDSGILVTSLPDAGVGEQMITDDDLRIAQSVRDSLNYRAGLARAGANQRGVTVAVNMVGLEGLPKDTIHVYYCVEGAFLNARRTRKDPYAAGSHRFPNSALQGNPSKDKLAPGVRYYFWVVREDVMQRLSEVNPDLPGVPVQRQPELCPSGVEADFCYNLTVKAPQ